MIKKSKSYYYNMYAPHCVLRKYLARTIYRFADKRYGVKARGEINNGFNQKQKDMLDRWHYWMRIKNKIYDAASTSLADRLERKLWIGQSVK